MFNPEGWVMHEFGSGHRSPWHKSNDAMFGRLYGQDALADLLARERPCTAEELAEIGAEQAKWGNA